MSLFPERAARRRIDALAAELAVVRARRPPLEGAGVALRTDLARIQSDAARLKSEAERAGADADAAETVLAEVRGQLAASVAAVGELRQKRNALLEVISVSADLPEAAEPAPQETLP